MKRMRDLSLRYASVLAAAAVGLSALAAACTDAPPVGPVHFVQPLPITFSVAPTASASATQAIQNAFDRVDRFRMVVKRKYTKVVVADTTIQVTPGQPSYNLEVPVPLEEGEERAEFIVLLTALEGEVELFSASVTVEVSLETTTTEPQPITVPIQYSGPGIRGTVLDQSGNPLGGISVELLSGEVSVAISATGSDGAFLFTEVLAGTYTVRPQPGGGVLFCPDSRSVRLESATSTVEVAFAASPYACQVKVLVLSGGDVNHNDRIVGDFKTIMPDLGFASYFVVHTPPSVGYLSGFSAVLLFEDGVLGDSERMGDAVAEYVRGGGNLVLGTFYWQNRSDGPFDTRGWGNLESLDPFTTVGGAVYSEGSLAGSSIVAHPLTVEVSSLTANRHWGGVAAKSGTSVVASWANGTPLIGYRTESGGQRIVGVSVFPGLSSEDFSGDFFRIWENALRWAGSGGLAGSSPAGIAGANADPDPTFVETSPASRSVNALRRGGTRRN